MAGWLGSAVNYLHGLFSGVFTDVIVAVILVLLGLIVGRIAGRVAQKALHEIETDRVAKQAAGIKFSLEKGVGEFVKYFIYFIFLILALNQIGLTTTILYMVSAGIITAIIVSFFLGVKDFMPNMLAGIFISRKGQIKAGDFIRVRGVEGKIRNIDLVETMVETRSGDTIYIPNSILAREEVVKIKRKAKN